MNKTVIFILFITLCSYALSKRASIDSILLQMVQVNTAAGKDRSEVDVLVAKLNSALRDTFEANDARQNKMQSRCEDGEKMLTSYINKLEADYKGLVYKQIEEAKKQAKAEEDENTYTKEVEATKSQILGNEQKIEDEMKQYTKIGAEAEQKVVAIKGVKDIITDELLVTSNSKSFVQLKTSTFARKVNDLKIVLAGITARESMYSPMITTLLTLAQNRNFSDQELIKKILQILSKLEENLRDFRKRQENEQKEIIQTFRKKILTLRQELKIKADQLYSTKSVIASKEDISKSVIQVKKELQRTIARKNFEIEYWRNLCKFQNEMKIKDDAWRDKARKDLDELARKIGA